MDHFQGYCIYLGIWVKSYELEDICAPSNNPNFFDKSHIKGEKLKILPDILAKIVFTTSPQYI